MKSEPGVQPLLERLLEAVRDRSAVFGVIGLGYVGLPLAKGLACRGFRVHGVEENPVKVDQINSGRDYIEPETNDLPGLLERITATTGFEVLGECQAVIICVPTPLTKNLEPDISYVERVSQKIGEVIEPGAIVILESTTYPGTTEEVVKPNLERGRRVEKVGSDYFLAFSPERVDPGNPHYNSTNTPKVIGGVTPGCVEAAQEIYRVLLGDASLIKAASSTRAAEMEKLFENIFRSVNIALVNELALICRAMELDVWEIIELASSKPYGFMPFWPGPGIGGHCIPLDPFYLSWKAREFDLRTRFIELAGELNSGMPRHVMELASEVLAEKGLRGAKILVVGAAYKPNISDYRESPSLKILELLQGRGSQVSYFDPLVPVVKLRSGALLESLEERELQGFDLVLLSTVHRGMDLQVLCGAAPKVLDSRGVTRGLQLPAEVTILGVGR